LLSSCMSTSKANLFIIGNAGTGKSLMVNVLSGKEIYESKRQAKSVTTKLESNEVTIADHKFEAYNIPGLLEADEKRVQENKKLIQEALGKKEPCIVFFVLCTTNGRVRSEDNAAYKAFSSAFAVPEESFMFIVNQVEEGDDLTELYVHVRDCIGKHDMWMLRACDRKESFEKKSEKLLPKLTLAVLSRTTRVVKKLKDLELEADQIEKMRKDFNEQTEKLNKKMEEKVKEAQEEMKKRAQEVEETLRKKEQELEKEREDRRKEDRRRKRKRSKRGPLGILGTTLDGLFGLGSLF